jgi:hypothetical protein
LLSEATQRQRDGRGFGGVIYAQQLEVSIGQCVHDLEVISIVGIAEDVVNQVLYLPF